MTDVERRLAISHKLHRRGYPLAAEEIMKMHLEIMRLLQRIEQLEKDLEALRRM